MKQMMTKGNFSIDRIQKIADFFGLQLTEFFELTFSDHRPGHRLTVSQENVLAASPFAMLALFLLGAGFNFEEVRQRLSVEEKAWNKILFTLDRAGFIEISAKAQSRLKIRGPYLWTPNGKLEGAVYKDYLNLVKSQVTAQPAPEVFQSTLEFYVSKKSLDEFKAELSNLIYKYLNIARIDTSILKSKDLAPVTAIFFLKQFDGWGPTLMKRATSSHRG